MKAKNITKSATRHPALFTISVKFILFFLFLSALMPSAYAADFGEDNQYLGQVVDDYENDDNIAAMFQTINNQTLDCMELNWTVVPSQILQNFSLYTESDEGGGITVVNDTYVQYLSDRSKTRYIYFDFGVDGLQDYKLYGHFVQDYHNIDAWTAFSMMSNYLDGEKQHRDILEDHTMITTGGTAGNLRLYEYDSGVFYGTANKVVPDDTDLFFKLEKNGLLLELDVYTTKALRDAEGNGDWFDVQLTLHNDYSFRYFYLCNNYDDGSAELARYLMYKHYFFGDGYAYASTGTYYVDNVLGGDPARVIEYNATIPSGTGITMEFSTDNMTWTDHNGIAGSDTLIAGYEALDLRDIFNGTTYRRVNQTSDGTDTPRMYQAIMVTVTAQPIAGGGLFPGLAIGISLLIIGAAYLVEKRR